MKQVNIVHIHTDYKFVKGTKRFEGDYFNNKIVIIKKNGKSYEGPYKEQAIIFRDRKQDLKKIIDLCNDSDLIVTHGLNHVHVNIICSLKPDKKVAWRFFGYELYGRERHFFLTDKTKKILKPSIKDPRLFVVDNLKKFYRSIKYGKRFENNFYKAMNRVNYFFSFDRIEYNFLLKYYNQLPEFIKLPYGDFKDIKLPPFDLKKTTEKPVIIVGNNRSSYNNHFDIIELIENSSNKEKYNFSFLINYGTINSYSTKLYKILKDRKYYSGLTNFFPFNEFVTLYQKSTALVINGYRQMAVGNIFLGIQNGLKIYLNKKGVVYHWLIEEGFKIYSLEDFKNDIDNNKVFLSYSIAEYNLRQLKKITVNYTLSDFQKDLYNKITERK